jgi:hypothetical protein
LQYLLHLAIPHVRSADPFLRPLLCFLQVSDWGATHSTSQAINSGLDVQMPDDSHFSEVKIQAALDAKNITMAQVDESCIRILSPWYKLPEAKRYPCNGATW